MATAPSTIITIAITGQTEFDIPFEYIARKFVRVTLVGQDRRVLTLNNDYRFVTKTRIALLANPPASYTFLELRRVTSATDRVVSFYDGSVLRANDLNVSQIQTIHIAEEARDSVAIDGLGISGDFQLDARGRRIVNLAPGIAGTDAVNLNQLVNTENSAGQAAQRAEQAARIAEDAAKLLTNLPFVTPEMLNAPMDGNADDAPFIQAAALQAQQRGVPLVLNGRYTVKSDITVTGGSINIQGTGQVDHYGSFGFKLQGTVGAEVALSAEITTFSVTDIPVVDASGFAKGDLAIIHSNIMCLSSDAGSMQLGVATASGAPSWFGEFVQINDVTGNTVTALTPLQFNQYRITARPNSGARTVSTLKKISPITGSISGDITFNRMGTGTAVEVRYGRDFTVKARFNANKLAGGSVNLVYSFACEAKESIFKLDPDVVIGFGSVNPNAPSYFSFNSVKCISSQACGADGCRFENGTQNFDVTYFEMPSSGCFLRNSTIIAARHNMGTSHAGSYANTFSGNTGVNCWRGIAARSREDAIIGNRLSGFRAFPDSPNTGGATYGMSLTEGFTIGAIMNGNIVSGFYRNFYINNSSSRGAGFDYNRVTISNNRSTYCNHHVDVANAIPSDKNIESGIVISANQFDSHKAEAIQLARYTRAAIIKNNVFLDSPSGDNYQIKTLGDCVGLEVTGNSFKDSNKTLWVQAITDTDLGDGSMASAQIQCAGNTIRGNSQSDSFVYANLRPSLGNNFQNDNKGYKYISIAARVVDYVLESESLTVVNIAPRQAVNLIDITGGTDGREITIAGSSANNPVTIKNNTRIQTRTNADLVISSITGMARFVFFAGKWRQVG